MFSPTVEVPTYETAKPGQVYLIRNRRTQEATYFDVHEALPYKGQTILYGETRPHQIRIYRGVLEWEGKPTCVPVIRKEAYRERPWALTVLGTGGDEGTRLVDRFWMSMAGGASGIGQATPTGAIKAIESEEFPILVAGRQMYEFWGGLPWADGPAKSRANRDGLVKATRKVLDLYFVCLTLDKYPAWFLADRRACLQAANPSNLWTP